MYRAGCWRGMVVVFGEVDESYGESEVGSWREVDESCGESEVGLLGENQLQISLGSIIRVEIPKKWREISENKEKFLYTIRENFIEKIL